MQMKILPMCLMMMFFCQQYEVRAQKTDADLEVLVTWMEGAFSSELQSKADTSYLDVRLHMKRIWRERTDGYWLLVEQSISSSQDKPYRQRVYHIHRVEENMIESRVFTWKDPAAVVGAWKDTTLLANLGQESIAIRRGCEVYMQMDNEMFFGSTHGTACSSDLRGAAYATSEVKILVNRIISWDRGFASDGNQVWGATKGGYVFMKQ